VTRAEHLAKLRRDLAELRARLGRIEGETFLGKRQIGEIESQLAALATEGEDRP
jgi:hypothetical protein